MHLRGRGITEAGITWLASLGNDHSHHTYFNHGSRSSDFLREFKCETLRLADWLPLWNTQNFNHVEFAHGNTDKS